MLSASSIDLDRTFTALADPTCRAILVRLAEGEATVGDLSRPFKISAPAISRHLRVLEKARLISRRHEGPHRHCSLNPSAPQDAVRWLEFYRRFWNHSFDQLEGHLQARRQ